MFNSSPIKKLTCAALILSFLFIQQQANAQEDFVLYNMAVVPQSIFDNPSFRPADNTVFVSMPLSSQYFSLSNTGFKFSDLLQHDGDSLKLNVNNMLSKLAPENYLTLNYQLDIFSFGFAVKKNYFSFSATEKVDFRLTYSQDFMNFIWNGNAGSMGQPLTMSPGVDFMHYRDYGFGWSRQIGKKLSLGVRLNYLYGMEDVNTENSNITVYTNPQNYDITAQSDILINTAGVNSSSFDNFNLGNYLFDKDNHGESIDLGATYKITNRLTISASVLDLGFITWNDGVTNYQSVNPGASFTYEGVDLNELINNNTVQLGNQLQSVGDSLEKTFKVDTLHHSYTTMLNTQLYASANYRITNKSNVGLLFYGQVYDNTLNQAVTLSYNQQVGSRFMACVSYSVYNRSSNNVGFGLAVNAGAFQFFTVTDNAMALLYPQNAQNFMIHFGFNLTFRHQKTKVKKPNIVPPAPVVGEF